MSPIKISAIKTHVPTISRISASAAHLNNFIGKQSRRSLSRGFSDGTDDEDQVMANVDWDEGEEDQSDGQYDNQQHSDDELPPPRRIEPTDVDSASEDEAQEEPPAPPKSVKTKTVKSVKGEKQLKPAEKTPKKPTSTKKQAKSDDETEETPSVKAKTTKKMTTSAPAPKTNKKAKDDAPPEKKQTAKASAKKPSVKATISEESASIGFENDEDDAKVMEKSKKSEDSNERSNKRAKPKVEDKEPAANSKNSRVRRPQLPKIKPASKKAKPNLAYEDVIDRKVFIEYRELIAPFFNEVNVGTKDEPEMVTIHDRYETMDEFYGAAKKLAKKMQKEAGESYSKHRIQIKKDKERTSVLKYIDGETDEAIDSNIEGIDALKFFRMNPIKKEFDDESVMAYLKGSFIDTVNILSINVKPLSLIDYDRLTQFSFYNDVEYAKDSNIAFDLPKYVDLIKNLHKWTMSKVFDARCNFLTLIPEADREKLWADAVTRFDEYIERGFKDERVISIMEIFNKLMHSEYFKQYLMFGAIPNALFEKIFKNFLDTLANKEILIELFTGPLESIGFMFTPFYFEYRDVEYGNDGVRKPTFDDLVKVTDDPDMYDPRTAIWIAKMV